jgi:hypothetical protein
MARNGFIHWSVLQIATTPTPKRRQAKFAFEAGRGPNPMGGRTRFGCPA